MMMLPTSSSSSSSSSYMLHALLQEFDEDGSGELDYDEFLGVLRALKLQCTERQVRRIFDGVDADGSGDLTITELEYYVRQWRRGQLAGVGVVAPSSYTVIKKVTKKNKDTMRQRVINGVYHKTFGATRVQYTDGVTVSLTKWGWGNDRFTVPLPVGAKVHWQEEIDEDTPPALIKRAEKQQKKRYDDMPRTKFLKHVADKRRERNASLNLSMGARPDDTDQDRILLQLEEFMTSKRQRVQDAFRVRLSQRQPAAMLRPHAAALLAGSPSLGIRVIIKNLTITVCLLCSSVRAAPNTYALVVSHVARRNSTPTGRASLTSRSLAASLRPWESM